MTTPPPASLADRVAEALMRWAESNNNPAHTPLRRPETVIQNAYGRAAAVLAVVQPELDAARRSARASEESATILQRAWDAQAAEWDVARVERDEARQQLAAVAAQRDRLRDRLTQAAALLPADPADDISASWIPARHLRAALAARTAT